MALREAEARANEAEKKLDELEARASMPPMAVGGVPGGVPEGLPAGAMSEGRVMLMICGGKKDKPSKKSGRKSGDDKLVTPKNGDAGGIYKSPRDDEDDDY